VTIYWRGSAKLAILERRRSDTVHANVQRTSAYQLVMCTLVLDQALVQDNDAVNPFERGDSVSNEHDHLIREGLGQLGEL
jgi:hypothetical protein